MLIRSGKILLSRRFRTGYEDGKYSLPAGHIGRGAGSGLGARPDLSAPSQAEASVGGPRTRDWVGGLGVERRQMLRSG